MQNKNKNKRAGWTDLQIRQWFTDLSRKRVRNYKRDIVSRLQALPANRCVLEQYGALSVDKKDYPLFRVTVGDVYNGKPNILITAGVHGYEPSGVEAAVRFLETQAQSLTDKFNFVVYPCISPWAYDFDHRWNNHAQDPNRLFSRRAGIFKADECTAFMTSMEKAGLGYACAVDLHETPDRDIELRQQRAARFGTPLASDYRVIPNGFYLIQTALNNTMKQSRNALFGKCIIDAVRCVSPIASDQTILGLENKNGAVFSSPSDGILRTYLGQYTDLVGVTEVYPDHPDMGAEKSVQAQLAAICGALRYVGRSAP